MAKLTALNKKISMRLTDIARHKSAERTDDLIRNWIRNRNTIEFLAPGSASITLVLNLYLPMDDSGIRRLGTGNQ